MTRLEVLADALMHYSGYTNPESELYAARNPGGLRAFSARQRQNAAGLRIFRSFLDGYQALLFDLQIKCSGRSNCKLESTSPLRDLMPMYGQPRSAARYIARWCRRALRDDTISETTPIGYFLNREE